MKENNLRLIHSCSSYRLATLVYHFLAAPTYKNKVSVNANTVLFVMKQKRGISYSRNASKRRKPGADLGDDAYDQSNNEDSLELIKSHKRQKTTEMLAIQSCTSVSLSSDCLVDARKPKLDDTPGQHHQSILLISVIKGLY